jgi:hypothetical protein
MFDVWLEFKAASGIFDRGAILTVFEVPEQGLISLRD